MSITTGLPSGVTMTGTQTPQKLFGDIPPEVSQVPGMVTPQITAAMPQYTDWGDIAAVMNVANQQREQSHAAWARAAMINNARAAQSAPQEHYLPGTASQTSGMGYGQNPSGGGSPLMMWAPRNLAGPQLGTWASQQQDRAVKENREIPMIMQAHTGDPFSPGETQGGSMAPQSSRGLYGPGLTSTMGVRANPEMLRRMWGGKTRQAQPQDVFPQQSLRERTSPGPQYQYDELYRG